MDLSPNDIRNIEFPNQMRGYDKDEVDSFLDQVAMAMDQTKQENLKLSMEVESLTSQLSGLKQFEDTIKSAAIDARRNADMTIATAKQEAEMLISKARQESEHLLSARSRDVEEIEQQITRLGLSKKSYLSKLRSLIQSHFDMIEEIDAGELPEFTGNDTDDNIAVTDSTDVTTHSRESLANAPESEDTDEDESNEEQTDLQAEADDDNTVAAELNEEAQSEPEPVEEEGPIDPELAAALENYKQAAAHDAQASQRETPVTPPPAVVETTARADDIPVGFFVRDENGQNEEQATDRVKVDGQRQSVEPNSLSVDGQESSDKPPLHPEKLAEELDQVAAKLDEKITEV